tara:strand:+ start:1049 stop:1663 length:615 start_codon:yes stop_codon:yes gene_type:complete
MQIPEQHHTVNIISKLINELSKLPGIGSKSAQRLVYHFVKLPKSEVLELSTALVELKEKIIYCDICQNLTDENPCFICSNNQRDHKLICVIEEPLDILAFERTRYYNGLYHVLHGVISPINGIGPNNLKIQELLNRLKFNEVEEIILATNPSIEGESTAMYLQEILQDLVPKVTRLARGLPVGGDIEYADQMTIMRALQGRQEI